MADLLSLIAPAGILVLYLILRKIWWGLRKMKMIASIDKIELIQMGDGIFSPDVLVHYTYLYQNGIYEGEGHIPLAHFLPSSEFFLYTSEEGIPVLEWNQEKIRFEEKIEHLLLGQFYAVHIHFDPVEPFHSELISLHPDLQSVLTE